MQAFLGSIRTLMLRVAASGFLGLAAVGIAMPEPAWGPCNMFASWLWVDGVLQLVPLCHGTCPTDKYHCGKKFTYPSGGGSVEVCRCLDDEGNPYPVDPPCSGQVFFNPDLPGYELLPCPIEENCGPVATPRYCEDVSTDIPMNPQEGLICRCPPLV